MNLYITKSFIQLHSAWNIQGFISFDKISGSVYHFSWGVVHSMATVYLYLVKERIVKWLIEINENLGSVYYL